MIWKTTLPQRKPFREAKLRIDSGIPQTAPDQRLLQLIVDAMEARRLVLGSPELSLNQLGKREGRCRTQLAKLLKLSWLSPRIVEAILDGTQPTHLKRATLLSSDIPTDWREQERLLGFTR